MNRFQPISNTDLMDLNMEFHERMSKNISIARRALESIETMCATEPKIKEHLSDAIKSINKVEGRLRAQAISEEMPIDKIQEFYP